MDTASPSLDEFVAMFVAHGGTDIPYLRQHFQRYVFTKQRLLAHWDRNDGTELLDIGAHWLHQALLYAIDGFAVTALDFPATLAVPSTQALAQAHEIRLLPNANLEHPTALATLPANTFDLVLFTEIIEHLAFNPVAMWHEIYRVMKPGARVVMTTPNYYAFRSQVRLASRSLRGLGGSVAVQNILALKTLSHHWKEYSLRELIEYFRLLSPDFRCINTAYVPHTHSDAPKTLTKNIARALEHAIPPLRQNIYLEIELAGKDKGIVIEPHW